jgi:hypothetical protein
MGAKVVAGCLGVVSRRGEVFVRFFVSGLGLIPKACIITVGYGLDCYASYFLSCFPDVYDSFSDIIVLDCDFKKCDDINCYTPSF